MAQPGFSRCNRDRASQSFRLITLYYFASCNLAVKAARHGAITIATNTIPDKKSCMEAPRSIGRRANFNSPFSYRQNLHVPTANISSRKSLITTIGLRVNLSAPKLLLTYEKATRQQGGLFFRENSSNGGKAIRTFWLHTKFAQNRCQG